MDFRCILKSPLRKSLDSAGGAVVHLNSGVAGLVCALFLGKRSGYGKEDMSPNSLVRVMIGASLLFVGWIGFNAGSAWAADGIASMALLNTMIGACAAALGWKVVEWIERKKPSLLGILSGLVAGLVGITPAAGLVDPTGALIIGLVCGPVCYVSAVWLKKLFRYYDSLDAFWSVAEESVQCFEHTVAWIDCTSRGAKKGRGIFSRANWIADGVYDIHDDRTWKRIPFEAPGFVLNRLTVGAFNNVYHHLNGAKAGTSRQHYAAFFYPLDAMLH